MQAMCQACGRSFEAKRATRKFCSDLCRVREHRSPSGRATVEAGGVPRGGELTAATLSELEDAGRAGSAAGRAALALARRVDASAVETGSGLAALVREHAARLETAVASGKAASDPLDELRRRREIKLNTG